MKALLINQIPEVNNKYTFSLAAALKKQGIDITVCGIKEDEVSKYQRVPTVGLFDSYSKQKNIIKKLYTYYKGWKNVTAYCKEQSVQIVHVQWYIFSPMDWHFHNKIRRMGIKVIATIHDLLPFNRKFYDHYFHKLIYTKADVVISQTKTYMETLTTEFGVKKEKVVYIPHGHYMEYAEPVPKEESRTILNLPMDRSIILFFGQIKKVKGLDVLIKALRIVADSQKDFLCVIAGKVWKDDFSAYQMLIDNLKLQDNVRTDIRYIEDDKIKYYFNAADMVVLPYRKIYQSGVVQLAYAYKKPVVATMEGELVNVVKNRETGLLVPSGDEKALARAICWYLEHPEQAKEFARRGKEDLSVRLSWDTIAAQIKEVYGS